MPILRNSQIQLGPEGLEFGASGSRKHEVCRHVSSSDVRSLCMPATIVVPETYHKGLWPRMSPESVWEEVLYRSPPFWEQCYFGNFHQALTGPKLRSLWIGEAHVNFRLRHPVAVLLHSSLRSAGHILHV